MIEVGVEVALGSYDEGAGPGLGVSTLVGVRPHRMFPGCLWVPYVGGAVGSDPLSSGNPMLSHEGKSVTVIAGASAGFESPGMGCPDGEAPWYGEWPNSAV